MKKGYFTNSSTLISIISAINCTPCPLGQRADEAMSFKVKLSELSTIYAPVRD